MDQSFDLTEQPLNDAPATSGRLSSGQKAAVIVRLLLLEDVGVPLERLDSRHQERIAQHMTQLRRIDPVTLGRVVDEFTQALEGMALTFPRGLDDALELLKPYLSASVRAGLMDAASRSNKGEAWDRIVALEIDDLVPLIAEEAAEVCAVLLSKLPVDKAAELLSELDAERAELISHAVALTGTVSPHTVNRIGDALAAQLDAQPAPAFKTAAADRVGLILNAAKSTLRDGILTGLDTRDADFAEAVRRTIFTFDHIPNRLEAGDVPAVIKAVPQEVLIVALAAGLEHFPLSADYLLDNISRRMADGLRDEATALGPPSEDEGEAAMTAVITAIRTMEANGELKLKEPAAAAE